LGEYQRAIEYHEQCLAIARELGDRRDEGRATWNLGLVYEQQGDLARAVELMQAAVHIKREIGDPGVGDRVAHLERLRQRLTQSQQVPPS
ncbi:MAG: tetratricopeptide repeat protein, partial [Chloroflexota bacterium]